MLTRRLGSFSRHPSLFLLILTCRGGPDVVEADLKAVTESVRLAEVLSDQYDKFRLV
jgi:hypothetical protein